MVLTPQMAISHLVMTIGVGISQKKNIKNFDDVQILWNDPYMLQHSLFKTFISAFSQGNGSKRSLILYFSLEASGGRVAHRFAFLEFFSP